MKFSNEFETKWREIERENVRRAKQPYKAPCVLEVKGYDEKATGYGIAETSSRAEDIRGLPAPPAPPSRKKKQWRSPEEWRIYFLNLQSEGVQCSLLDTVPDESSNSPPNGG